MEEKLRKMVKTGYGLGLLSLEQAKSVAQSMRRELHLDEHESKRLARELVANSENASREVLQTVDKYFSAAVLRSGVLSKKELAVARKVVKKKLDRMRGKKRWWG